MTDFETLRAWWSHRQGLDGTFAGKTAAETLGATGWARSVGGSAPYLGLFARAGLDRAAVDAEVADLAVHELPSARGCTYVLPSTDFALGLAIGAGAPEGEIAAAAKHLDVSADEVDGLCVEVVAALDKAAGPLDPAAIKAATGDAVHNLGEAGRKRGVTTTLPLALGILQARGEIRRVPVNGRLDQQRYGYVTWSANPADRATALTELARRYFGWAGPASLKHFRWFAGCTATAAKAAVADLDLVPLDGDLLLPNDLRAEFDGFTRPERPHYALVAAIDGIHLLHRDLARLLDQEDKTRPVPAGKAGRTLGDEADPPTPVIVDRGRIVGLWEFDPDEGKIVHQAFVQETDDLREAIDRTQRFVADQLGDVRSVSLDSPASRKPRLAALRA